MSPSETEKGSIIKLLELIYPLKESTLSIYSICTDNVWLMAAFATITAIVGGCVFVNNGSLYGIIDLICSLNVYVYALFVYNNEQPQ